MSACRLAPASRSAALPCQFRTFAASSRLQQRQRQHPQQRQQRQRLPAAAGVVCRSGGGGGRSQGSNSSSSSSGRRPVPQIEPTRLIQQYGLPTLGLLVAASLIGPLVGALVFGAVSVGILVAAAGAALSLSWLLIPLMIFMPALGIGAFVTLAGGALILPSLIQLALIGGGLWLGVTAAQQLLGGGKVNNSAFVSPNGTIDVEVETVDDDEGWRKEMSKEQRDAEAELREFDDLMRRRDEFKNRRN